MGFGQRLADGDEVVAAILQAAGDLGRELLLGHGGAEGLEVAPVGGPGEGGDLVAGVVDVEFLGDGEAGLDEEVGEGVAHHRTAAMADMHGPGRVGGDVFDVHGQVLADRAVAIGLAGLEDGGELGAQSVGVGGGY